MTPASDPGAPADTSSPDITPVGVSRTEARFDAGSERDADGATGLGDDGATGSGADPGDLDPDELERRTIALANLIEMMRPAVQMDGGDLALLAVDYTKGVVEVQLQGACGSCAISSSTLQGGVERLLKERLDWVREVRGGVDDSLESYESAAMGRGAYVPRYY